MIVINIEFIIFWHSFYVQECTGWHDINSLSTGLIDLLKIKQIWTNLDIVTEYFTSLFM